jgi:hypothetical protein
LVVKSLYYFIGQNDRSSEAKALLQSLSAFCCLVRNYVSSRDYLHNT